MSHEMFNWLDYAIIGIIGLSVLVSIARGFVREALSLATWIAAVWISIHFYHFASEWLRSYIISNSIRMIAAFLALFCLSLLLGSLLSFMLVQFVHKTGLSGTDRTLGMIFGLARGVLIVSIALLIMSVFLPHTNDPEHPSALQESHLAPEFKPIMDWLKQFLPENPNTQVIIPEAIHQMTQLAGDKPS